MTQKLNIQEFLNQDQKKDLLRLLTAGPVDDGKSTLIGRLMFDSKMLYEDQLAALERDSKRIGHAGEDIDCLYGDLEYVGADDTSKVIRKWKSGGFDRKNLKYGWMPPHPTFFAKKEIFDKHGLYNLDYRISADYDLMLRILLDPKIKVGYIPEVITKMRVGGTSNKSIRNIIQKSTEDLKIIKSNHLPGLFTLFFKNFRKLNQFM